MDDRRRAGKGAPATLQAEQRLRQFGDPTMPPSSSAARAAVVIPSDETATAAEIVEKFLVASMIPDRETAARYGGEPVLFGAE